MTIIIYSQDTQSTFQNLTLSFFVLVSHFQFSNIFNNFSHLSHECKLIHLLTIRFIQQIYLDSKSHLHNTHNNDFVIYVKVWLEEEHILNSNCDGRAVAPPIFMVKLLQDETLSVPLSNPTCLCAGKHRRRITRQSVF